MCRVSCDWQLSSIIMYMSGVLVVIGSTAGNANDALVLCCEKH